MSSKKVCLDSHSVKDLLKETLTNAISNIAKHLEDFLRTKDPESLHQYRVNIRMARSICKEFSTFMEKKRQKVLDDTLKVLQQETNEMRDIDVFIACIETYKTKVDEACVRTFKRIEQTLLREKKVVYTQFCQKYASNKDDITAMTALLYDENLCLPKSQSKLFVHVQKILEKRLKKIAKLSQKIDIDSPNEQFHKLRLHYKKLRYTCDALHLDAFAKSFKPIQTAFGAVQDKNIQIKRVQAHNADHNAFLEQIVVLLEQDLVSDKRECIEKSNQKSIEQMHEKLHYIFTCKKS